MCGIMGLPTAQKPKMAEYFEKYSMFQNIMNEIEAKQNYYFL